MSLELTCSFKDIEIPLVPQNSYTRTFASLRATQELEESALRHAQLLKYAVGAAARVPEIQQAQSEWWAREREEGEWAREDEELMHMAKKTWSVHGKDGDAEETVKQLRARGHR